MFLSSYLLLSSQQASDIIKIFSSTTGREYLKDALDDLTIIKEYASEYSKPDTTALKRTINTQEVMDIAYSYVVFQQTGECGRYTYTSDNEYGFEFTRKSLPFNQQTIFEAHKNLDAADFMVEEPFSSFVKDWIRNSKTLFPVNVLYALGYNNATNKFGFAKPVIYNDKGKGPVRNVSDKTLELLFALLDYANSIDMNANTEITYVDNAIKSLMTTLSIPKNSHIIFGMSYNRLNKQTSKTKSSKNSTHTETFDTTAQTLKKTQDKALKPLTETDPRQDEYLRRIYADCKVILNARKTNLDDMEFPATPEAFVKINADWLINTLGVEVGLDGEPALNHPIVKFINGMYDKIADPSTVKNIYNSMVNLVNLFAMINGLTCEVINETLGLSFTQKDYTNSAIELYDVFGIPFLSCGVAFDILYSMKNNIGISSESDTVTKPSANLVKFAFVTARTSDSMSYRKNILSNS